MTTNENIHPLIIIGSGPAGLTAGIYTGRAMLNPLIIEGNTPGGQLMGTTFVENWPGEKSILGPQLMMKMREHAQAAGCSFVSGEVVSVDFHNKPFSLTTHKNSIFYAHSVIIATGATPKQLGCPGEDVYWGKGVSTCAVCDGIFYKDKPIVIVGGGDTAMENASFMTNYSNKITIVHIGDALTASPSMQERIVNNPAITIIYNSTVTEVKGDGKQVTNIIITNQKTQETSALNANALFVAIGLHPNTTPFRGQLELLKNGYLMIKNHTETSVPGVFCAGDVADFRYRQAITSAGAGCMAALDAERYIKDLAK